MFGGGNKSYYCISIKSNGKIVFMVRIKYRAEQLDAKILERKYIEEEKRQEEIEKERRLEALREQVCNYIYIYLELTS